MSKVYQVDFDCTHCSILCSGREKCDAPVDKRSGSSHYCTYHMQLVKEYAQLSMIKAKQKKEKNVKNK